MFRRITAALVLVSLLAALSSCAVHMHKIGTGAAGADVIAQRQWYVLWGLVPLNNVDTAVMSAGATNYDIRTETTVLDFVINVFTGIVTVNSRTVTVKK